MTQLDAVSTAVHQSQAQHFTNIIRWLIIGWASSVIALGAVLYVDMAYEDDYEVTTETTTDTDEVAQDSGDGGMNHYIGGDFNGEATYSTDANDDENDGEADTSA